MTDEIMNQIYIRVAVVFLCVIGLDSLTNAQSLDSLYEAYYSLGEEATEERYELLGQIVDKEMFVSTDKVVAHIDTLAELARVVKGEKDYNRIRYRTKGFAYVSQNNNLEALECYRKYAQVFDKKGTDDGYFLIDVGNIYYSLSLYKIAKKTYQDAEQLFTASIGKEENAYNGLGTIYGNYSLIAEKQHQLDSAIYYSGKFLKLQEDIAKDTFQLALSHFSLASVLIKDSTRNTEEAIDHYEKTIAYLTTEGLEERRQYQQFIVYLPLAYSFLATAYNKSCNYEMTDFYIKKSIEEVDKIGYKGLKMVVYGSAGEAYTLQKRYTEAIPLLDSVLVWSIQIRNTRELSHALRHLIRIYSQENNYERAFDYTQRYMLLKDTLQSKRDELMVINEMVLERENQITIAQQKELIAVEKQLNNRLYLILFLVLGGMFLTLFFQWQLRKKNKLIKAYAKEIEVNSQMNEVMLSVVGHDLRSPFSVVTGNARQILEQTSKNDATQIHQKARRLYKSSKQAYMMMDGLLQWVALRKNGYQIRLTDFELTQILHRTVEELRAIADNNGITIEIVANATAILHSDRSFLQIIIRNILTNAIKHSQIDTTVNIETIVEEKTLKIIVTDTGDGFSKEAIQDFGDQRNNLEIAKKGHGLGLSIVKELSEIIGLRISLGSSENRRGAVVMVEIPATQIKSMFMNRINDSAIPVPKLTTEKRSFLLPFITRLEQYDVFEGTEIQKIVSEIEMLDDKHGIDFWLSKLKRSIADNDEELYDAILKEVKNEK
jgi:signal transduction histidine kinase